MWQDDFIPARVSKKRGGNTTESATLETEVSEASELQSPVVLACPVRQDK